MMVKLFREPDETSGFTKYCFTSFKKLDKNFLVHHGHPL